MTRTTRSLILLLAEILLITSPGFARPSDPPATDTKQLPFAADEELYYEGEFSRLLLRGIDIADLTFRTTYLPRTGDSENNGQKVRFTAEALSKGVVVKLFGLKFRERVDSTVAVEPFGTESNTRVDEQGKRVRTSTTDFDLVDGKVTYTELDPNDPARPPRVVSSPLTGEAHDIASVFYYLRTQKLELGTTITVQISDSGQVYSVPVKISAGKKIKTVLGKLNTIKVEPDMFGEGKLLRGKGSLVIYMTDDRRHVPVKAQIKMEFGTVDITLKRAILGRT
ncbi:MAG: DUF3108 domain-containing protein [Pyrinomonadaceae bacterium]